MELRHNNHYLAHANGSSVQEGETVISSRDEQYIITGGSSPHKPSSSGLVQVQDIQGNVYEYYPHVFNLEWKQRGQMSPNSD